MNKKTAVIGTLLSAIGMVVAVPSNAEAASTATKAINFATAQLGDVYSQANPQGPNHWDCSGLVQASFKSAGKSLPRVAQDQYNRVPHVSPGNRRIGDLVFIGYSGSSIYHVGIYIGWKDGKGWIINANSESYRDRKVVKAPLKEYTAGSPRAYYGRVN